MGDRLTQLQDAADQLVHQFIACYYYIERRHELETFGPNDKIHDLKDNPKELDSLPPDVFQAGQLELRARPHHKEQQIEYLISSLPGLDNSEHDQEQLIKDLEEELRVAEAQRLDAIKEKDEILVRLDQVLRSIRRN